MSADAVRAADDEFFDALRRGDRARLDEVLSSEFLIVDVLSGHVTARESFLDGISAGDVVFVRIEVSDDRAVRRAGTAAVVVGSTYMEATVAGGERRSVSSRYTHVFAPSMGGWQLLSAQGTPVSD